MSINPPLDIVLDVARAADPARYKAAVQRLTQLSPSGETSFDSLLELGRPGGAGTTGFSEATSRPTPAAPAVPPNGEKAYRDFEAMTLAFFIETSFPDDASEVFGSGTAGGVWKSMLAEQIANQMARAGGIGIARQLASFEHRAEAKPGAPVGPVSAAESPFDPKLLVMTAERGFIGKLADSHSSTDEPTRS